MKRVLVIITTSFVSYGGLATVALNYYRNINKELIKMDFASTNQLQEILDEELRKNGSCYIQLPPRYSILSYIIALNRLAPSYDCIHIYTNSATASLELFALRQVSKRIVHIHNTTCTHKFIHAFFYPYFKAHFTDAIACSQMAGKWIFGEKKFKVLNNAIDLKKYNYCYEDRLKIRKQLNIGDAPVIGNVGKLVKQKNHVFIMEIFSVLLRRMPQAKLVLVGGGNLHESLVNQANDLGIENNVIFCGMAENAGEYYSAFDCVLFPSLWEGLPLSLIEAQACGLTCVASDVITAEVNMGGVLQLSLNDSIEKWIDVIQIALNVDRNKSLIEYRQNIKRNGFDIKKNAAELEKIYLE